MQTTQPPKLLKNLHKLTQLPQSPTPFKTLHNLPTPNPTHPILPLLRRAAQHHHPINDLRAVHAHTITSGLSADPFGASRLIKFSLQTSPAYARAVFASIDHPDVYTWNAMIAGHSPGPSAVRYYFNMRARAAPPNNYTFALLAKAAAGGGDMGRSLVREVHGQVVKCGVEELLVVKNTLLRVYCELGLLKEAELMFGLSGNLDIISWNTMLSGYGRIGDLKIARNLFERMPKRSLASWTALIDAFVTAGHPLDALRVFDRMRAQRVEPDAVNLVSVLKACAETSMLHVGRSVHRYIDRKGLGREVNVVLATALVDMYAKCGCVDAAVEVFDGFRGKADVVLWNAMIGGLTVNGHGKDAVDLLKRMREREIPPNGSTFLSVLCGCVHSGEVECGVEVFESMKRDHGVEPQREHYGCVANLLGRVGRTREAESMLLGMPMEVTASQWGALMSACKMHGDTEVEERVGRRMVKLEPHDGGRYVLLSNALAAAGRWDDARITRVAMEDQGVKKEAGCSFI
ncbi:Pentatricopeptide repeat-containing protein [Acorus gramineus]|uniref:Pentatricopeptide repeat-containing protein n=1 Tax=Acorus gramineus TaxID=55184 RepID=A0AAV9BM69_ACOGR|nr:Pentatricopeptide repeat-containing protein [Acorus gramineus]